MVAKPDGEADLQIAPPGCEGRPSVLWQGLQKSPGRHNKLIVVRDLEEVQTTARGTVRGHFVGTSKQALPALLDEPLSLLIRHFGPLPSGDVSEAPLATGALLRSLLRRRLPEGEVRSGQVRYRARSSEILRRA